MSTTALVLMLVGLASQHTGRAASLSEPLPELAGITDQGVREQIAQLPYASQQAILGFAIRNPHAFQETLKTASQRGWKAPGPVFVSGARKPRAGTRVLGAGFGPALLVEPRVGQLLRVQDYHYTDSSGELWVWEWNCGDDAFCASMSIYGNGFGEEFTFAIEYVPTSEHDGYVRYDDPYSYDPGDRFGGEGRGEPIPMGFSTGPISPSLRRVQGEMGSCVRDRALCLGRALDYNWGRGIAWDGAAGLASCLPWVSRISRAGYIGCAGISTGISRVFGFVRQVVEEAPQCVGTCSGGGDLPSPTQVLTPACLIRARLVAS